MKKSIALLILVIFTFGSFYWFKRNNKTSKVVEDEYHIHAGFVVFNSDNKEDFSLVKYMHLKPCTLDGEGKEILTSEEEQLEKAHLHDRIGDVVHVHRKGSKWRDLFINLNYPTEQPIKGYIDGKNIDNILDQEISAYESTLFIVGNNKVDPSEILNQAVTQDYIKQIESNGESC